MLKSIIISFVALFSSPSSSTPQNSVTAPQGEAQVWTGVQRSCLPWGARCGSAGLACCSGSCSLNHYCK